MIKIVFSFSLLFIMNGYLLAQGTWTQMADIGYAVPNIDIFEPRVYAVCIGVGDKGYFGTGRISTSFTYKKDWWSYDSNTGAWTQKANLSTERLGAVVLTINGKIYVGGGLMTPSTYLSDFNEYDPANNKWNSKAIIPGQKRNSAIAFAIDDKGYVGLGASSSTVMLNDFWQYTPSTDTWAAKSNFSGGGRSGAVAFAIAGKGYITTGATSSIVYKNDLWQYDPSNDSWLQKTSSPATPRTLATGFSLNDFGYLATGLLNNSTRAKDVWKYDPVSDTWVQKTDVSEMGRYGAVSMIVNGKAFIGTGFNSLSLYDKEFWKYDETNDIWAKAFYIGSQKRYNSAGFAVGEKGYVCCGFETNLGNLNDLWEFNPALNCWTQKANYPGGYINGAFAFGIGDKGYVGGGTDPNSGFYMYDPATNQWSPKTILSTLKRPYASGFVINGKGYAGLGGGSSTQFKDLYEYDPVTDTWTQKANLPGIQRSKATSFVVNGKAYVGAGTSFFSIDYKDFYQYDPSLDSWSSIEDFPGGNREEMAGFGIGNYGYAGFGMSGGTETYNDLWLYDPSSDTWLAETALPADSRRGPSCFIINSTAYVGLGSNVTGLKSFSDFYSFTPPSAGQSLVMAPLSAANFCSGYTIEVSYITFGSFSPGNIFTVELSDTSGSFGNPVPIGSVQSVSSGVILASFPLQSEPGSHYKIRVVSSDPIVTSEDNGLDLSIAEMKLYYEDIDEDNYGNPAIMINDCMQPEGFVSNNLDCDDGNALINPAAMEFCNDVDDNCNLQTDENSFVASITPGGTIHACDKVLVILQANTGTGIKYKWYRNNAFIQGATNSSYSTKQGGSFMVEESKQDSCFSVSLVTKIKRDPIPVASITPSGSTDICATGSVVLMASSGTGFSYQWLKENIPLSGATLQSYTAVSAAKYKVEITSDAGCTNKSVSLKVTSSCKASPQNQSESDVKFIKAYPNPATNNFTLEIPDLSDAVPSAILMIYDQWGRRIYSKEITLTGAINHFDLNRLPEWPNGMYHVEVVSSIQHWITRIVFE
jgi:N-acetylneuraminic acid mutarotase